MISREYYRNYLIYKSSDGWHGDSPSNSVFSKSLAGVKKKIDDWLGRERK